MDYHRKCDLHPSTRKVGAWCTFPLPWMQFLCIIICTLTTYTKSGTADWISRRRGVGLLGRSVHKTGSHILIWRWNGMGLSYLHQWQWQRSDKYDGPSEKSLIVLPRDEWMDNPHSHPLSNCYQKESRQKSTGHPFPGSTRGTITIIIIKWNNIM